MKIYFQTWIKVLCLCLFCCCEKEIQLTGVEHEEQKLIINGIITDQSSFETITVNWSANLNEDVFPFEDQAIVSVALAAETYLFTHQGNGKYQSTRPIQGQYGSTYEFSVLVAGVLYTMSSQMPYPVQITAAQTQLESNLNNLLRPDFNLYSISAVVNSQANQYVKFLLFEADSIVGTDTTWQEINVRPRNRFHQVNQYGLQELVLTTEAELKANTTIRVELWALDNTTGSYLDNLSSFSSINSNELFGEILPTRFSNNAYGVGYGTSISKSVLIVRE